MVYVDEIRVHPPQAIEPAARYLGARWCHLFCEPGCEAELHEVAKKIGMRHDWFQDKEGFPHYDLVPSRRERALHAGATFMSLRDWLKWRIQRRLAYEHACTNSTR